MSLKKYSPKCKCDKESKLDDRSIESLNLPNMKRKTRKLSTLSNIKGKMKQLGWAIEEEENKVGQTSKERKSMLNGKGRLKLRREGGNLGNSKEIKELDNIKKKKKRKEPKGYMQWLTFITNNPKTYHKTISQIILPMNISFIRVKPKAKCSTFQHKKRKST